MLLKIFIYDDSAERISSLTDLFLLDPDILVLGSASNCSNVFQEMKFYQPDVVLMDINMPIVNGLEGLKIIKTNYPQIQVLIQTAFDDDDKIMESIKNGASGYVLKSDSADALVNAVKEVYNDGGVMNPTIAKKVLQYFNPKAVTNTLSNKEVQVLELLAQGLSYRSIATQLNITYHTVNSHIKQIYTKLHISSLGEALAYYYKHISLS
jgi:DNA-binding NarL/FixJ family response regulator